jgi:hypothetical protein
VWVLPLPTCPNASIEMLNPSKKSSSYSSLATRDGVRETRVRREGEKGGREGERERGG